MYKQTHMLHLLGWAGMLGADTINYLPHLRMAMLGTLLCGEEATFSSCLVSQVFLPLSVIELQVCPNSQVLVFC